MQSVKSYLADWTTIFLKNRDLSFRKIDSVGQDSGEADFVVNYREGRKQHFFVFETLDGIEKFLSKFNADSHVGIAAINSRDNFGIIIAKWVRLVQYKNLSIYLINPFSSLEKKWILHPYTHDKITEPSSLKAGLKALFDTVEPITLEEFARKLTAAQ